MSYTCDWCGEPIEQKAGRADLIVEGLFEEGGFDSLIHDNRRHFHCGGRADEDSCMLRALRLIDNAGSRGTDNPPSDNPSRLSTDREPSWSERCERVEAWRAAPTAARESRVLQVLGDDALTQRELRNRLEEAGAALYERDIRYLLTRMLRAGQLDRVKEPFRQTGRYRYFRRRGLEGPIADLERAFHDDGEAVA